MPLPLIRIGLIGDRNDSVPAHVAIPRVLGEIGQRFDLNVQHEWLETAALAELRDADVRSRLGEFEGLWCVPNCPYASMEAALNAIRIARENDVPFLGTCGGFQHAIIEYARNVLCIADADHAEVHPHASTAIITPLSCSLVGHIGPIHLASGSQAALHYGRAASIEKYHCNYGLNKAFQNRLHEGGLHITGFDDANEPRFVELPGHPFFMGTLFQPERSSTEEQPHPLISAFVMAAGDRSCAAPRQAEPGATQSAASLQPR